MHVGVLCNCPCEGIVLDGDDQQHCWQLESPDESSWQSGDTACQRIGGHLGHPEKSVIKQLLPYIQEKSLLPILTGILAGNIEIPLYAKMCQNNNFYDFTSENESFFLNQPNVSSSCAFLTGTSTKLSFEPCSTDAMALCDRPLEKLDYCNIMANCSITTTTTAKETETATATTVVTTTTTTTTAAATTTTTMSPSETTLDWTTTHIPTASKNDTSSTFSQTDKYETTLSVSDPKETTTKKVVTDSLIQTTEDPDSNIVIPPGGSDDDGDNDNANSDRNHTTTTTKTPSDSQNDDHDVPSPTVGPITCTDSTVAPIPLANPKIMDYSQEKTEDVVLPPKAVAPEPVYITVPEKHESVYGFHTKEIVHVYPEKPQCRDVGVNTDQIGQDTVPAIEPYPVVPVKKRKAIKKPKKMFIPSTITPLDEVDEELKEDVPLDLRSDSPGGISVAPMGDTPVSPKPLAFVRNAKPVAPEPKQRDDAKRLTSVAMNPKQDNGMSNDDPRAIRSPPPPGAANATGKPLTFSPIPDDSDDDPPVNAIPSPPPQLGPQKSRNDFSDEPIKPKKTQSPIEEKNQENSIPAQKSPLRNKRLSPNPESVRPTQGPVTRTPIPSTNPFANLQPQSSESNAPSASPLPSVGMRAARGRLGGAVKGGGGGGEAPAAWKPWAKHK
ncbi:unnamed protein product [Caenorhabditis bovis]|uniref:C-type lectin domain-containing protein n=1 Tax=Caenorhabditis bovis TaxID=2654633 RepID=A0A8S1EMJ0_9PELO|nr:unnamed protein product [Caenorhabditis bovis]